MKIARMILAGILSLQLSFPAHCAAPTPVELVDLVEEYIVHMKSQQTGSVFLPAGRQEYLSKAVAAKIAAQEPENFNLFLFFLIDSYVKRSADRPYLFSLMQILRDHISSDLEATRLLQEGPAESIKQSVYSYWIWIALTVGISWKLMLSRSAPLTERVRHINEGLAQRGRLYQLPYRMLANPLTISLAPAVFWGYFQYFLESHRTHRLDPGEILKVVQAQMACHLSYRGLEIQDQFEAISSNEAELKTMSPELRGAIDQILTEANQLQKQNPYLLNLRVNDRFFTNTLKQYPESKSWQQFRRALNTTSTDQAGTCRQVSLDFLSRSLQDVRQKLPAAPTTPPRPEPRETSPP